MKSLVTLVISCFTLALMATANGKALDYEFDTVHSQIIFKVNHLGYSNSYGKFRAFDGTLSFDANDWSTAKTEVSVNTKSIDLENKKWNDHMRNADFFDVGQFPTMTFKSTKLEKISENTGKLHGDLTILGTTQPITLDLTLNQAGIHPMSEQPHVGFSATGTIKRSEFGMIYGVPAVGDDVHIIIEVEASAK